MVRHLFSTISIRNVELPNRIVMPPMATSLAAEDGKVTPQLIKHYTLRAQASVGLIIIEHAYVSLQGRVSRRQLGIHSDEVIPGMKELTQSIHSAGGKVCLQISHGGSICSKDLIKAQPLGPSSIKHPAGRDIPKEMSREEIKGVVSEFCKAAERAKEAGFDMIEIHGAHGFLLNQFFSPLTNRRSDEYGGSRSSRLRLSIEIIEGIRSAVDEDFPVLFRLGGDDRMYGGLTVDDAHWAALRLVRCGVDVIDLSGGLGGYDGQGQGYFVYLAEAVKPVVDIPVMISGGIRDPHFANSLIEEGKADLVGIGRALLEDPQWAEKAKAELAILQ
ncbi:MAG TPA: NADH oxidase [Peptococcaceae bacterium]|nr:MAG: NADH:flavin oxidoreductase [Clostridia bacterium 41_269]HBT20079.1 NADH oxidase [Peptococcaceae bacterium]